MRLHYERIKQEREEENNYLKMIRDDHREGNFMLGKKVVMMSTKPTDNFDMRGGDEMVDRTARELDMLTSELESL